MNDMLFYFRTLEEIASKASELGAEIPLSYETGILAEPLDTNGLQIPNRIAIQPMEGCDASDDGSPAELTFRRYNRFASSGAGILWMEAVSIAPDGRANPRQLMLTEDNLGAFQRLVDQIKEDCVKNDGFAPVMFVQLTHSGRYVKPLGMVRPVIACNKPGIDQGECIVADDSYLQSLEERFAKAAALAKRAGFDAVDIKACHGYLFSELLSAYGRPGPYGGSFENRTRLLRNTITAASAAVGSEVLVTTRLNLFDGYPDGWGVDSDGSAAPDMSEPIALARQLYDEYGVRIINCTIGNPYRNPHINRPYSNGPYPSPEHPIATLSRSCSCIRALKKALPDMTVISSQNSFLRQFSVNMAAGMLQSGGADIAGFGRMAFAYPEFANDIIKHQALDPKKCCIACSKCTELMRSGSSTGCVVHDPDIYIPLYREYVLNLTKTAHGYKKY